MTLVGKKLPHDSALGHVQGTAPFIDDHVRWSNELFVAFKGSPLSCGTLARIDIRRAETMPGVAGVFTAADVDGRNAFGPHFHDEAFLVETELLYLGQPVALVAADTDTQARNACAAIEIEAIAGEPVLSIEQAIAEQRFIGPARTILRGKAAGEIERAPRALSGVFHCGGQEQFYLESQAARAFPDEEGQLVVYSSTQNPTEIQAVVAEVLGLRQHQVICICQRMGGAFGGKETQAALPALMATLVARKTGRPARVVYNKDEDMQATGKRHAYRVEWRVGFEESGRIRGLAVDFYSNGGAAADLSLAVMERTMLHAENSYFIPHVEINGRVCFTNLPPNTAFRGFGGPQAMAAMENVIESIAHELGRDALDVRRENLYGVDERNVTPYGQRVVRNHLPEIVSRLATDSRYQERRAKIEQFNSRCPTHLRGIAITPVKFGISFTTKFLNQANALVNVFTDGTVQVSTGGTEMGQGLNTKIRQLVADELAVAWEDVRVLPTSTERNNNTSATAASASTDLNGTAAVFACQKIKTRLRDVAALELASVENGLTVSPPDMVFADGEVFDRRAPELRLTFGELAALAHRRRVDLGARGFYATPGVDYNRETGRGNPFLYFTQGAAAAEVQIDRFTGELVVRQVDLLIDIGESINPGVDMGQITGGFVQGLGWVTAEALVYDERGGLLSHSPTTYKIPAVTDLPPIFRCALFANSDNVENVARSKAVGEPPLMLAISVWAAVAHALSSLALGRPVKLQLPATGEEILGRLTELTSEPKPAAGPAVEAR